MNKSRVESAVQELPPRNGRGRSDVSSLRSLDNLLRRPKPAEAEQGSKAEDGNEVEYDAEVEIDAEIEFDAEVEYDTDGGIGGPEGIGDQEGDFLDPEGIAEVLSGEEPAENSAELEFTELNLSGDEPREGLLQARPAEAEEAHSFAATLVEKLILDLRGPLLEALRDAERVLVDPERVSQWLENQARRRLLALTNRLSDELQTTEVKRVLTSPPGKR